jgi:hypothetical protein
MSSADLRDVAIMAVSSAYRASSTWREGTGMSLTYRLKGTGETSPHYATPACMQRRVDVAFSKAASNSGYGCRRILF